MMYNYPQEVVSDIVWTRLGLRRWREAIHHKQAAGYLVESVQVHGLLLRWLCVAVLVKPPNEARKLP